MADLSKIKLNGSTYNLKDAGARGQIGNLSNLTTTTKTNLVAAINEAAAIGNAYAEKYPNTNAANKLVKITTELIMKYSLNLENFLYDGLIIQTE